MKRGEGPWDQYRSLPGLMEVDFHFANSGSNKGRRISYHDRMGNVYQLAIDALRQAYSKGYQYVMFTHGYSTSRRGNTTSRSVIRGLIRSKEATPYILRSKCIQHNSVFVAAIRHNPSLDLSARQTRDKIKIQEWNRLCKEYEEVLSHIPDGTSRPDGQRYINDLEKNVPDLSIRCDYLKASVKNYQDQLSRNAGIFHQE